MKAASRGSWPAAGPSSPRPRSRRSRAGRAPPPTTGAIPSRPPASAASPSGDPAALDAKRALGLVALRRQRERLEQLRALRQVGPEAFLILQEELDFLEVSLSDEAGRRIEQS